MNATDKCPADGVNSFDHSLANFLVHSSASTTSTSDHTSDHSSPRAADPPFGRIRIPHTNAPLVPDVGSPRRRHGRHGSDKPPCPTNRVASLVDDNRACEGVRATGTKWRAAARRPASAAVGTHVGTSVGTYATGGLGCAWTAVHICE
jgi:hypothetical protein